jgi:hypothetical protein
MRLQNLSSILIASCLLGASAPSHAISPDPNPGGRVNALSYFIRGGPGCTATASGDPRRTYWADPNPCSTGQLIYHTKGAGGIPWTTEIFIIETGFIRLMQAVDNPIRVNQIERDRTTGRKGERWIPTGFSESGTYWSSSYADEDWVDANGQPACWGVDHSTRNGSLTGSVTCDTWPAYLRDCRNGGCTPASPRYDVAVIDYRQDYGVVEHYYYGKWFNPTTNLFEGLGLIGYDSGDGNVEYFNQLIDCYTAPNCANCPDP